MIKLKKLNKLKKLKVIKLKLLFKKNLNKTQERLFSSIFKLLKFKKLSKIKNKNKIIISFKFKHL